MVTVRVVLMRGMTVRQAFQPDLVRFTVRLGHRVLMVGLTYIVAGSYCKAARATRPFMMSLKWITPSKWSPRSTTGIIR